MFKTVEMLPEREPCIDSCIESWADGSASVDVEVTNSYFSLVCDGL